MATTKRSHRIIFLACVLSISISDSGFGQPVCKVHERDPLYNYISESPEHETFDYIQNYVRTMRFASYTPMALLYGKWAEEDEDTTRTQSLWDKVAFACHALDTRTREVIEREKISASSYLIMYSNYRDNPKGEVLFVNIDYRIPGTKIGRILYRDIIGQIDQVERIQYGKDHFFVLYSSRKDFEYDDSFPNTKYRRCVERSRVYIYRLSDQYKVTKVFEEVLSTSNRDIRECGDVDIGITKGNYFIEGGEKFKIHLSFLTKRDVPNPDYEKRYVYDPMTQSFLLEYTDYKE